MDEERSESDVVAQSIGPQEGICEQGCADASSLRAQIDGKTCKEENGTWVRASTRFEGIWESDALHCSHRQGVEAERFGLLRCDENASISGAVVLPREAVEPIVYF
jgi:hypothetical protein